MQMWNTISKSAGRLMGMGIVLMLLGAQGRPEAQTARKTALKVALKAAPAWEAKGTLFEACSCSVPCPCNFGQPPSRGFCHTIYAYRLKTARYNGVVLDGLIFGGGEGPKGAMGFVDSRATVAQRPLLEKLALAVFGKGGASSESRAFTSVRLIAEDSLNKFRLDFGEGNGFAADVLIGADGKNPIIVENNTTWPVHRFIKGKTTRFDYKDTLGNQLQYDGVNANLGEFNLSSNPPNANGGKPAVPGSCCASKK